MVKLKGTFRVTKTSDHEEKGDKTFEVQLQGADRSDRITITGTSDDLAAFDYGQELTVEISD